MRTRGGPGRALSVDNLLKGRYGMFKNPLTARDKDQRHPKGGGVKIKQKI